MRTLIMVTVSALAVFAIASVFVARNSPASAENDRQRVERSCRTGMTAIKEAAFIGFPNASEAEREQAETVFEQKQSTYCGCVAEAVPIERLKASDLPYVHYMLENAAVDQTPIEQKLSLAWRGLDESRMGLLATSFVTWTLKCPN